MTFRRLGWRIVYQDEKLCRKLYFGLPRANEETRVATDGVAEYGAAIGGALYVLLAKTRAS